MQARTADHSISINPQVYNWGLCIILFMIDNVKDLQNIMTAAGFEIYSQEWWHFNDSETAEKVKCEKINPDDY